MDPKLILIVEDEASWPKTSKTKLSDKGHNCLIVSSGEKAIEILKTKKARPCTHGHRIGRGARWN